MPRLRTEAAKKSLLRRVRKQRLKYITILPSLITILNGISGFAAIIFASKDAFALAGYMVLLAMLADMLDGQLARRVKSTSSFGGQLDSLCDVISFGVAPAFLMLKILEYKLDSAGFADESFLQRFIWLTAAAYISCAAIRLARFNVENEEDESAHMSFIGLPTPAAAGVIVSLIIFHQKHQETLPTLNIIIYPLPFLVLGIAVLMVSRIRYPHVLNQYLKGRKPFGHFIRVLLLLAFLWWARQVALVLIFCGFAASSFVKWLYQRVPILRVLVKWIPKVIRNKGNLIPAAQHFDAKAIDEAQIDQQDDSAH
jgi:CDP-diacylglycerol--serine O-phosphatidyltransferase